MRLVKLVGAVSKEPIWVNPELIAAVEHDGENVVVVLVGCANPIKVTADGAADEVAALISAEESK